MMDLIVIALLWALTAALYAFRRTRTDKSVLYAAVAVSITATVEQPNVYVAVDEFFGGRNFTSLLASVSLMFGVYYIVRAVAAAGKSSRARKRIRSGLVCTIILTTFCYLRIPLEDGPAVEFMATYGHTHAAASYLSVQFAYMGLAFLTMVQVSFGTMRAERASKQEFRAAGLLAIGSLAGMVLSASVIVASVARVAGLDTLTAVSAGAKKPLIIVTVIFLALGLTCGPLSRWRDRRTFDRRTDELLREVSGLWGEAVAARPSLNIAAVQKDPERLLHRQVVEIRDAAIDRTNEFTLRDEDRAMLARVEIHLLAART